MRRLLLIITLFSTLSTQARQWTANEVKDIIRQVNTYWQTNNPAEVRAFWDNAAYHTGNMEVYKLLEDEQMLNYSIRWAEHNQWKGATEPDPVKWKYKQYGEGQDYVLFGDWQICFQTYIDLYNLSPDEQKVARAKEVMDNMIMSIIGNLQSFSSYAAYLQFNRPRDLKFVGLLIYETAYKSYNISLASAYSWILFLVIGALTFLVLKSSKTWVYYAEEN